MSTLFKRTVPLGLILLAVCLALNHEPVSLDGAPAPVFRDRRPDLQKMTELLKVNRSLRGTNGLEKGDRFWLDEQRKQETTVERMLIDLGASLRGGKVVDSAGREIYLYKVQQKYHRFSSLPPPTPEKDIAALKQQYHVIRWYGPLGKE